jgi:hypothetical protein
VDSRHASEPSSPAAAGGHRPRPIPHTSDSQLPTQREAHPLTSDDAGGWSVQAKGRQQDGYAVGGNANHPGGGHDGPAPGARHCTPVTSSPMAAMDPQHLHPAPPAPEYGYSKPVLTNYDAGATPRSQATSRQNLLNDGELARACARSKTEASGVWSTIGS